MVTPPSLVRVVNLTALRNELLARGTDRAICSLINEILSLRSIVADLTSVDMMCKLLVRLAAERQYGQTLTPDQAAIDKGLATHIVVGYARCITKSGHRGGIEAKEFLKGDLLQLSNDLMNLRNDTIAHFGPGPNEEGAWHESTLYLKMVSHTTAPTRLNYRSANYMGWAIAAADTIVPLAISYSYNRIAKKELQLAGKLDEASDDLINLMISHMSFDDAFPVEASNAYSRRARLRFDGSDQS